MTERNEPICSEEQKPEPLFINGSKDAFLSLQIYTFWLFLLKYVLLAAFFIFSIEPQTLNRNFFSKGSEARAKLYLRSIQDLKNSGDCIFESIKKMSLPKISLIAFKMSCYRKYIIFRIRLPLVKGYNVNKMIWLKIYISYKR